MPRFFGLGGTGSTLGGVTGSGGGNLTQAELRELVKIVGKRSRP